MLMPLSTYAVEHIAASILVAVSLAIHCPDANYANIDRISRFIQVSSRQIIVGRSVAAPDAHQRHRRSIEYPVSRRQLFKNKILLADC